MVDRDRFFVGHRQDLYGNVTDLTWKSNIYGMDNRFAAALTASHLDFFSPQSANFPGDTVTLVNPMRGFFLDAGPLTTRTSSATSSPHEVATCSMWQARCIRRASRGRARFVRCGNGSSGATSPSSMRNTSTSSTA